MNELKHVFTYVPACDHGKRLDTALAALYPGFGLRARRRLWEWCRVLLDGREAGRGDCVRAGQRIEIIPFVAGLRCQEEACWNAIRLVYATDAYAAAFKPGGIPSARLGGAGGCSAEEYLRINWANFGTGEPPLLCNRLDTATSGLLLLAFGQNNLNRLRVLEAAGAVEKFYYALVRGVAAENIYIDHRLNTDGRKKTLALPAPDPDATRHTMVRRLHLFKCRDTELSLIEILIRRGARHQIRAHLAAVGLPILGDVLYGGQACSTASGIMYLHHYRVSFDDFTAQTPPDWADAPEAFTLPDEARTVFQLL